MLIIKKEKQVNLNRTWFCSTTAARLSYNVGLSSPVLHPYYLDSKKHYWAKKTERPVLGEDINETYT